MSSTVFHVCLMVRWVSHYRRILFSHRPIFPHGRNKIYHKTKYQRRNCSILPILISFQRKPHLQNIVIVTDWGTFGNVSPYARSRHYWTLKQKQWECHTNNSHSSDGVILNTTHIQHSDYTAAPQQTQTNWNVSISTAQLVENTHRCV